MSKKKAKEILPLPEIEAFAEASDELAQFATTNIFTEEETVGFLPEASSDEENAESLPQIESVEGTELDAFESAEIEDIEFIEEESLDSILESILFASDRPVSLASLKLVFKGTNIKTDKIKRALDRLAIELASGNRGVSLEEVPGGFQLRTKVDNLQFISRTLKARQFRLSGPALEVLAIVAYKQPLVKSEIDDIRGVESGHLLRALMEKGLVCFEGKSELPGKPMQYGTTKKFLEIFSLRNLKELPTLSQIDELLPEGMTEEEAKPTLSQITDSLSQNIGSSYSEGEEELTKITNQLGSINTNSEFFLQEKLRQKQKRDLEKAQNIREMMMLEQSVPTRDKNWLVKFDEALARGTDLASEEMAGEMAKEKAKAAALAAEASMAAASIDFEEAENSVDEDLNLDESVDIEA
jgi:segregation and condensation protein B